MGYKRKQRIKDDTPRFLTYVMGRLEIIEHLKAQRREGERLIR
jgi:hypothetical protein